MSTVELAPTPAELAHEEPKQPKSAAEIAQERFEDWKMSSSLPMKFEKAKAQIERAGRYLWGLGIKAAFAPKETVAETKTQVSEATATAAQNIGEKLNSAWQGAVEKKNSIIRGFQERVEGIRNRRQERVLEATQKIKERKLRELLMDRIAKSIEHRAAVKEYEAAAAEMTGAWKDVKQAEQNIATNEAWINLIKNKHAELLQQYVAAGGIPETTPGEELVISRERAENIIGEGEEAIKRGAALTQDSEIHRLALAICQNMEEKFRAIREIEFGHDKIRELSKLVASNQQRLIELGKIAEQKSLELSSLELERRQAEAA